MSRDISKKVFRLHIIANSDSDADQSLKLKVRDGVLDYTAELFEACKSVTDAVEAAESHLKDIRQKARGIIAFFGYDYDVKVYTAREYFKTRVYDAFTLPAGFYDSLKIVIGEGSGRNWWCVMYPSVCISGCTDDFKEELSDEEIKAVKSKSYIVKFKIVELYEEITNKHKK